MLYKTYQHVQLSLPRGYLLKWSRKLWPSYRLQTGNNNMSLWWSLLHPSTPLVTILVLTSQELFVSPSAFHTLTCFITAVLFPQNCKTHTEFHVHSDVPQMIMSISEYTSSVHIISFFRGGGRGGLTRGKVMYHTYQNNIRLWKARCCSKLFGCHHVFSSCYQPQNGVIWNFLLSTV